MNPNDDDNYYNDDHSDLFPNAGQRVSSHNFYSNNRVDSPPPQSTFDEPQQDYQQTENNELDDYCPRCDARLELRESTLGKYIACSRFPECRFTKPYADAGYDTPAPETDTNDTYNEEDTEKDYLKEAENTMRGYSEEDQYSHPTNSYQEPEEPNPESDEPFDNEYPEEEQPEVSHQEDFVEAPNEDNAPREEMYEEPLEQQTKPIEETKTEKVKPVSFHEKTNSLRLHPGFLKKEEVTNSSRWAELKQKRLRDQKVAALAPTQSPADMNIPTPEEMKETLRKLEEDVQRLQTQEGQQLAAHSQQTAPHQTDNHDEEYDDDVLPPSLRQALREKTNNDNDY